MEIKVSGKIEMIAMMMNPTVYLESLKLSANCAAYLVAIVAPLITIKRATVKIKILLSINYVYFVLFSSFGPLGIEPSLNAPKALVLPVYYGPD